MFGLVAEREYGRSRWFHLTSTIYILYTLDRNLVHIVAEARSYSALPGLPPLPLIQDMTWWLLQVASICSMQDLPMLLQWAWTRDASFS